MKCIQKKSHLSDYGLCLQELEEFVVQKLCEVVTERCELGDARQRCQLLEQMVEQWRRKAQQLQKQVIYLLVVLSCA